MAETVEIPAKSRAPVDVTYRPVVVESIEDATLTLSCEALGAYPYALRLSSTPAGPERGLAFSVPLGSRETKAMKFTHYLDEKAEYACAFQTNTGEFECAAAHTAHPAGPEGMEQELEVTFEPTAVGAQIQGRARGDVRDGRGVPVPRDGTVRAAQTERAVHHQGGLGVGGV